MRKDITCGKYTKKTDDQIGYFCFYKKMKAWKLLPAFFLSILISLSGCASINVPKVRRISINQFEAYETPEGKKILPKSVDETIPDLEILKINQEIKSLLDEKVIKIKNLDKRLKALTKIILEKIEYDILIDRFAIKTAQETFDTGTGNCLSFSNLFVAMARYAGFKIHFQEIPTLPSWSREKETIFITRHIGASIDMPPRFSQLIQINITEKISRLVVESSSDRYYFAPSYLDPRQPRLNPDFFYQISDNRAFAQFYNNIGCQLLAEGNGAEAFRYFVKAIKTDPKLSFPWSNLGVLYRRNNQLKAAEAAYFQGLSVTHGLKDISTLSIMSNLVSLYNMKGDIEKAEIYKNHVASFRKKNPYYQYYSAKTDYDEGLYEKSVKGFREAIRLKSDEHLFYYGLALAYSKIGEVKKAEKSIDKAIHHSSKNTIKTYYKRFRDFLNKGVLN